MIDLIIPPLPGRRFKLRLPLPFSSRLSRNTRGSRAETIGWALRAVQDVRMVRAGLYRTTGYHLTGIKPVPHGYLGIEPSAIYPIDSDWPQFPRYVGVHRRTLLPSIHSDDIGTERHAHPPSRLGTGRASSCAGASTAGRWSRTYLKRLNARGSPTLQRSRPRFASA
jgi:hypothetical protein